MQEHGASNSDRLVLARDLLRGFVPQLRHSFYSVLFS